MLILISIICILQFSNCVESTVELASTAANIVSQNLVQVKGSGKLVEKEISAVNFSNIENASSFDIEINQGEKQSIKVLTDDNIQDFLYFEQKDEKITFSIRVKASFQATKAIIYITVLNLKSVISSGTGDIEIGKLLTDELKVENNGTGDIKYLEMLSKTLTINNSGTGDIKLGGIIENINIDNSGTGDITAIDLEANSVAVNNSGTGDVSIKAKIDLKIDNTGTGDVKYYGEAKNVKINSSGTGEVIKK